MKHPPYSNQTLPSQPVIASPIFALFTILLLAGQTAHSADLDSACGPLGQPFGDYLVDKDKVAMSEKHHFTPEVESLIRGKSTVVIGHDIDFMLKAYPNHHRALVAIQRLAKREGVSRPRGATYSVGCYFQRAIRFRPDDVVVRMLFASYLLKDGRRTDGLAQLDIASGMADDNPFTHYNIGLIQFEAGNFEAALKHAHIAYRLGFQRPELRDMLIKADRWVDLSDDRGPLSDQSSPQNTSHSSGSN